MVFVDLFSSDICLLSDIRSLCTRSIWSIYSNACTEFPANTKTIYWQDHGINTYLPYMVRLISPLRKGQIVNANIFTKHKEDINWVCQLNEILVQNQDCVLQLDYSHNTTSQRKTLNTAIRDVCSKGKVVIVNNWYPPKAELSFDPESISAIQDINEAVVWQGKQLLTYVSHAGIDFSSERCYGQSPQVQQEAVGQ